jgi:hypothetical protein
MGWRLRGLWATGLLCLSLFSLLSHREALRGSMELTCCGLDCRERCCVEGVKKLESPRTLMK